MKELHADAKRDWRNDPVSIGAPQTQPKASAAAQAAHVSSQRPRETDLGYQRRIADTQDAAGKEAAHTPGRTWMPDAQADKLLDERDRLREQVNELLAACKACREWCANHFNDFDSETNSELLCLDNDMAEAIRKAELSG